MMSDVRTAPIALLHTVTELPEHLRDLVPRVVNRGLFVRFVNRDLFSRAHLDMRRSTMLYDCHGLFLYAVARMPDQASLRRLYRNTPVRYFTRGMT